MDRADAASPRRYAIGGWRVERFEALDSTSEEARRRAFAGDPGRLWVLADRQIEGRGRHGRAWRSPPGNFYGSALLVAPCPTAAAPQLGFVAGVAAQAAAADLGARGVELKWPNDLVAGGAKLAGLLIEGWTGGGRFAVSIGLGVNLAHHPEDLAYPATNLGALVGATVGARAFLERLAPRLDAALVEFDAGRGFASIRRRWLAAAAGLGRPLRAIGPRGAREGLFEGIDEAGRLLLRRRDAIEAVESADIALMEASPPSPTKV